MTATTRLTERSTVSYNTDGADVSEVLELPRDPSDYVPTTYFITRYHRDRGGVSVTRTDSPIMSDVITTCITEGQIDVARGGAVKFVADVDGVEWRLVVQPSRARDGGRVLTAYAPEHHVGAAMEGDR